MGKTTSSSVRESGFSAPFDLDHGSAKGNSSTTGATTIDTERLGNGTIRIPGGWRKRALSSSHHGECSSVFLMNLEVRL
jgi:hypothetical protein